MRAFFLLCALTMPILNAAAEDRYWSNSADGYVNSQGLRLSDRSEVNNRAYTEEDQQRDEEIEASLTELTAEMKREQNQLNRRRRQNRSDRSQVPKSELRTSRPGKHSGSGSRTTGQ